MEHKLKQRLVGAAVLAAIAVIFLPSLLQRDFNQQVSTKTVIPPVQPVEPLLIAEPQRPKNMAEAPKPDRLFVADTPDELIKARPLDTKPVVKIQPEPAENPSPKLGQGNIPEAWVVQVGSFKDAAKAQALTGRLKGDGYKAYQRTFDTSSGKTTRVYVGPKLDKRLAQKIKQELDQSLKLQTMVLAFKP